MLFCSLETQSAFLSYMYVITLLIILLTTVVFVGQGLIKIRGDQCWRDLTCMNYHYEVSHDKKKLQADGLCIVLVA